MKQRPSFPARLGPATSPDRRGAAASGRPAPTGTGRVAAAAAPPLQGRSANPAARVLQGIEDSASLASDPGAVRRAMVRKLAAQGIQDPQVLQAMAGVERHRFVDSALRAQAYEDTSLPIGLGQTISKPGVVARMLQLLRNGREGPLGRVLEIGTGCGYQAAVLSLLASEVYSIERLRGLHDKARENLRTLRLPNVHLLFGDGMLGFAKGAPYAGIVAAAGGEALPQTWLDQLAVGGRLVAPVAGASGAPGQQALVVVEKSLAGLRQTVYEGVHFVPLKSGVA